MKKLFVIVAGLLALSSSAQMKEGRIVYQRTFQLPTRIFGGDPNVTAQLPKSRTDQYELLFGNNQSLWQYMPDANQEGDPNTISNGNMILRFGGGGSDVTYFNFDKGSRVDQREIVDKSYIVTDSIQKLDWKMTDETKTILIYTARKATSSRISQRTKLSMENGEMKREPFSDTAQIVAWFTTDVPVPIGPAGYQGQLPGLILELDEGNGQTVYKAIEVSPKVNTSKIKEPKDGKKLTAAQFDKEREKVMEEMRKNMPSGMQIRTNTP
jgi:GLPGLI family protein